MLPVRAIGVPVTRKGVRAEVMKARLASNIDTSIRLPPPPCPRLTRAERIARTETTRALNAGILLAAASVPFEVRKEWITAEDERVRGRPFSHVVLHGRSLPIDLSFNNGENIRFPGDPNASASNVINCRCVLNIIPSRDQFGRPIPRQVNASDMDILNLL